MSKPQHQDTLTTEVHDLKEAMSLMDCYAQEGLSGIESIAELALLAMETPKGPVDQERYARAFEAILRMAREAMDYIGHQAEQKGCGHQNEARLRRRAASVAEQQKGGAA